MIKYSSNPKQEDSTDVKEEPRDGGSDETDQTQLIQQIGSFQCLLQASNLQKQSDMQTAIAVIEVGLEIDPLCGPLYNALGHLYLETHDLKKAAKAFDEAAVHSPTVTQFQIDRIVVRGLQMKPNEAMVLCHLIKPEDPEFVFSLMMKAECLRETDQRNKAIQLYEEAIKIEPNAPDLRLNLGNLYAEEGLFKQAGKCFLEALKIDPEFPEANFHLAHTLERSGELTRAVNFYQKAVALSEGSPFPLIALGLLYGRLKDPRKSHEVFENALIKYPDSPYVLYNQGVMLLGGGAVVEACASFERMVAILDREKRQKDALLEQIKQDRNTLGIAVEISRSPIFQRNEFNLDFLQLIENFPLLFPSQHELMRKLAQLHTKIDYFPFDYRTKLETKEEVDGLQMANSEVFIYMETFVMLAWRFVSTLSLPVPITHSQFLTYRVFNQNNERKFLRGVNAPQICLMISQIHHCRVAHSQIEHAFVQFVSRDGPTFDPEEYFFELMSLVVSVLGSGNRKLAQIKSFQMSGSQKLVLDRLFTQHKGLQNQFSSPAQLLALKDFVLIIIHILGNFPISEKDQGFLDILRTVYSNELYSQTEKTMLFARTSTVFMREIAPKNLFLEFKLRIQNPDRAICKRGFIFEIFSGTVGPDDAVTEPEVVHWRSLSRSPILRVSPESDWSFRLADFRTESTKLDSIKLRIVCWRQNRGQKYTRIEDVIRPALEVHGPPKELFLVGSYYYFWGNKLHVLFGFQTTE
jgi:tetratricopeptide (TPR) repeat protein